jgi:hypothetical protein
VRNEKPGRTGRTAAINRCRCFQAASLT